MKTCTKCGKGGEFHKNKTAPDGLHTACKNCRRKANAAHGAVVYGALRANVVTRLGSRCCSKECRWLNEDNTFGCTDQRALQIDHIFGGGSKEAKTRSSIIAYYRRLAGMKDIDLKAKYQLLCACCNWIKRSTHAELYKPTAVNSNLRTQ